MILDTIAASTLERVAAAKEALPLAEQIARARDLDSNTGFPFEQALAKPGMSFICEVKKASPSKGLIAAEFPYVQIAREYEVAGADAISVLTEPAYFQGKNEYLTEIRQAVKIPLLRKDFTVDEYMIYEAKNIGANAVLLICAILSPMQLSEYAGIAGELGLSALVEAQVLPSSLASIMVKMSSALAWSNVSLNSPLNAEPKRMRFDSVATPTFSATAVTV